MRSVIKGATFSLRFVTQAYNNTLDDYKNVVPDVVYAQLETNTMEVVGNLTVIQVADAVGEFDVLFDTSKFNVDVGDQYYIAFYWQYGGKSMCERVKVRVVYDAN